MPSTYTSTRNLCSITWKIIGDGEWPDSLKENDCLAFKEFSSGHGHTCENCYHRTHEGSERYINQKHEDASVLPQQLIYKDKNYPVDGKKRIVTKKGESESKDPSTYRYNVVLMERIKRNPYYYPKKEIDREHIKTLIRFELVKQED